MITWIYFIQAIMTAILCYLPGLKSVFQESVDILISLCRSVKKVIPGKHRSKVDIDESYMGLLLCVGK